MRDVLTHGKKRGGTGWEEATRTTQPRREGLKNRRLGTVHKADVGELTSGHNITATGQGPEMSLVTFPITKDGKLRRPIQCWDCNLRVIDDNSALETLNDLGCVSQNVHNPQGYQFWGRGSSAKFHRSGVIKQFCTPELPHSNSCAPSVVRRPVETSVQQSRMQTRPA